MVFDGGGKNKLLPTWEDSCPSIRLTFNRFDGIVVFRCCYDQKAISQSLPATAPPGGHLLFLRTELCRQPPEIQPFSLENQLPAIDRFAAADAGCALCAVGDLVDDYHFL